MIIIRIMGGLGNQMFQYAFGKALSLEYKDEVCYDVSCYQIQYLIENEQKMGIDRRLALNHFNIDLPTDSVNSSFKRNWRWILNDIHKRSSLLSKIISPISKIINNIVYKEDYFDECYPIRELGYHSDVWNRNANTTYFVGFWQSEKYFMKYRKEILHDFQIVTPQSNKNAIWNDKIMNSNSVSLHVRRGDYDPNSYLNEQYYYRAIEYIAKHVENPVFFVFSDDIQWVKENLTIPYEVYYMEQNNQSEAYEDLRLMLQCKHNIIANSSFSWWGAWLNQNPNNIVIAPNHWIDNRNINDIIPDRWIKL